MQTGLNRTRQERNDNRSGSTRQRRNGNSDGGTRPGRSRNDGYSVSRGNSRRSSPGQFRFGTGTRKNHNRKKASVDPFPVDLSVPGSIYSADRRSARKKFLYALLALFLLVFIYLSFRTTKIAFLPPWQTVANLFTCLKLNLAGMFHMNYYESRRAVIEAHPAYLETTTRLSGVVSIVAMRAAMSVAGVVFQSVFRNPIAVPTMLGVSSGINIANFILVMQFSLLAVTKTSLRFIYGYIGSLSILFLVIGVSRLTSKNGSWSVVDVLLIGTTLTRVLTQILSSIQNAYMDDAALQTLSEMNMYGTGIGNARGWIFLALALLFGMFPVLLMRNSLNVVTFTEEESKTMGLNANVLRVLALIFSTILIVAAQIYCGDVGMLALLVPHACRYLFGSNTRDLIFSSIIVGGIMMILCRFIVALTMFNQYLSVISVGMIINVISIPLMIFILFTQRRGWE